MTASPNLPGTDARPSRRPAAREPSSRESAAREPAARSLTFPPGFRFGAATAAHQVEGGTTANQWTRWEVTGRPDGRPGIAGRRCGAASDHWRLFESDLYLMSDLGLTVYRFSVEWSRIEPVQGQIDTAALERYRHWCRLLREAGIEPMVTLHHFTEPVWFAEAGGFENPDLIRFWVRFVELVAAALGDLVDLWVTVNEPTGYALQGWWFGNWPPGATDFPRAVAVVQRMLTAHARAAEVIRRVVTRDADGDGMPHRIGLAHHVVPFRPRRAASPADRMAARLMHDAYNVSVLRALQTGVFRIRLPGAAGCRVADQRWRNTVDWLGVNAYYPLLVGVTASGPRYVDAGFSGRGAVNDLGWDLDPSVLGSAVRFAARYGLPLMVTEHGTCDADRPDDRRRTFLAGSLAGLRDAVADGVPVEAYLHWSLLDNFEWAEGFGPRFGLFRVDYPTGRRDWTTTARLYQQVIEAHRAGAGYRPVQP